MLVSLYRLSCSLLGVDWSGFDLCEKMGRDAVSTLGYMIYAGIRAPGDAPLGDIQDGKEQIISGSADVVHTFSTFF